MIKSQKEIKKANPASIKLPQIKPKNTQQTPKVRPSSSNNRVEQLHKNLFDKLGGIQVKNERKPKASIQRKSSINKTHNQLQQITSQSFNTIQSNTENDIKNSNGTSFEHLSKYMPQLYSKLKQMHKEEDNLTKNPLNTRIETKQKFQIKNQRKIKQSEQNVTFLTLAQANGQTTKQLEKAQEQQPTDLQICMNQQEIEQMYRQLYKNQVCQQKQEDLQQLNKSLLKCQRDIDGIQSTMVNILKTIGYQYTIL